MCIVYPRRHDKFFGHIETVQHHNKMHRWGGPVIHHRIHSRGQMCRPFAPSPPPPSMGSHIVAHRWHCMCAHSRYTCIASPSQWHSILGIHISLAAYGMDWAMLFRVAGNGFASAMWFCTMAHCSRRRRCRRSDLYYIYNYTTRYTYIIYM